MSDTPDNLVLALLREIRADTAAIRRVQEEHGIRLIALEAGQIAGRREAVNDATSAMHTSHRVDDLTRRIDRIERRLELQD